MSAPIPRQPELVSATGTRSQGPRERDKLTRKWAYLIGRGNYLPLSGVEVEERFATLVDGLVKAAASDPLDSAAAARVGATMVEFNCVSDDSLSKSVEVLGRGLLALPELNSLDRCAERIVVVLGSMATGYVDALRRSIFEQQEHVTKALFIATADTKRRLVIAQARFDEVLATCSSGVAVTDLTGKFLRTNESLRTILDRYEIELSGLTLFDLVTKEEAAQLRPICAELTADTTDRIRRRRTAFVTSGETVHLELTVSRLRAADQLVVVLEDDSELTLLRNQLKHQSLHDVLTGLPNRQFLTTRLEAVLNKVDQETTLYQLDLDAFSMVTGGLGRHAGDQVLRKVADRLCRVFFGERAMVARLDGDEFAVLVENSPATPDVVSVIEWINDELAEPIYLDDGHGVAASVSIGVVHRPPTGMPMEDVLRTADLTLRRARRNGSRQWGLHDPNQDAQDRELYSMAAAMPGAWETGEIRLVFQRQVDLRDGRTTAIQSLLHWDRPGHGAVDHEQCVNIAEQTGLVLPLGAWLLHNACEQAMRLPDDLPIGISLPPSLACDPDLVGRVLRVLDATGLPADRLHLGLPIDSLTAERGDAADNLAVLSDTGVEVVVEEFGTGARDLVCLEDLPIGSVRIARWLVRRQARRDGPGRIVSHSLSSLFGVLHESGTRIAVDGIDTEAQADWWLDLGCDRAAGNHFGPPDDLNVLIDLS
jgi:diguanylate cyclase (GGDEF)-like protein/PAS domain S-box-containing protein